MFLLFNDKKKQYYDKSSTEIVNKNKKIYRAFLSFIPIINGNYTRLIQNIIEDILENIHYFPNFENSLSNYDLVPAFFETVYSFYSFNVNLHQPDFLFNELFIRTNNNCKITHNHKYNMHARLTNIQIFSFLMPEEIIISMIGRKNK